MATQAPPENFMSMVEVKRVNGVFIDIQCWDFNDQILTSVFAGSEIHPPPEEGDIYLMGIHLDRNLWKVGYCSERYETFEFTDDGMDDGGKIIPPRD